MLHSAGSAIFHVIGIEQPQQSEQIRQRARHGVKGNLAAPIKKQRKIPSTDYTRNQRSGEDSYFLPNMAAMVPVRLAS